MLRRCGARLALALACRSLPPPISKVPVRTTARYECWKVSHTDALRRCEQVRKCTNGPQQDMDNSPPRLCKVAAPRCLQRRNDSPGDKTRPKHVCTMYVGCCRPTTVDAVRCKALLESRRLRSQPVTRSDQSHSLLLQTRVPSSPGERGTLTRQNPQSLVRC